MPPRSGNSVLAPRVPRMRAQRSLLVLLGLAISIAAIILLLQIVDVQTTLAIMRATDPVPLVLTLAVVAAQLLLRSLRWSYLLAGADANRVPVARLVPVLMVGYLGNTLLPARLGEAIRAFLVGRREGIDFSRALGTVVLERVLDVVTLAVVGGAAAVIAGAPAWIVQGTLLAAAVGVVVALLLLTGGVNRVASLLRRRADRLGPRAHGWLAVADRFAAGAGAQPPRVVGIALLLSAASWLLDGTTFWLVGIATGADLAWQAALLIAAVTVLGTAIPAAPGYVGTFEFAAVATAIALGQSAEAALAIAVLAHVVATVPVAAGGALATARMSLSLKTVASAAEQRLDSPGA